jgi:hypothetical protein
VRLVGKLVQDGLLELRFFLGAPAAARASMPSRLTVASTPAACSPPMTQMRALGHIHKKRGL